MKSNYKNQFSFGLASLLMISQSLVFSASSRAEVKNRANGRCAFIVENQRVFDGHCTMKHKTTDDDNQVVVVTLDNGNKYLLRGRNLNNLKIQAWDGIHNVSHTVNGRKEEFTWSVAGERNRLITTMDNQYRTDVSVDDDNDGSDALGIVIGVAAGALIGSLISGAVGNNDNGGNDNSSGETPSNLYSTTPSRLRDLVDARAGQAEGELKSRGYSYRNTQTWDGGKTSYYIENSTGYCVEVGTVEGRYSSIVYNSSDRCEERD